jgi:hypothetical protein
MEAIETDAEQAKTKDFRALDSLFAETCKYKTGKEVKEFFECIRRFPHYSPFNASLINAQKPGSRYVATPSQWRVRFGRTIKPGARPLVILQPHSPVNFVFDVGDTEGVELPERLTDPFKVIGEPREMDLETLTANLKRDRVKYLEVALGTTEGGSIGIVAIHLCRAVMEKERILFHLSVNDTHSPGEKLSVIAHELGHLYCGHLGTPCQTWWPDRRNVLSRNAEEFEAESVAWLVCERAGLKIPAARYLSGYMDKEDAIPEGVSLELVIKSTGMIEAMYKRKLPDREVPKPKKVKSPLSEVQIYGPGA